MSYLLGVIVEYEVSPESNNSDRKLSYNLVVDCFGFSVVVLKFASTKNLIRIAVKATLIILVEVFFVATVSWLEVEILEVLTWADALGLH